MQSSDPQIYPIRELPLKALQFQAVNDNSKREKDPKLILGAVKNNAEKSHS